MKQWTPPTIAGCSEHSKDAALFARLNIPQLAPHEVPADGWTLMRNSDAGAHLTLRRADRVSLAVDFTAGKARHRVTESGHGAQTLIKAIGVSAFARKHAHLPCVIDATGGLCQDAWALASAGCQILVLEQHPVVHALVADGLQRAMQCGYSLKDQQGSPFREHKGEKPLVREHQATAAAASVETGSDVANTAGRITLMHDDAARFLSSRNVHKQHVIYLDPMYPAKRKSAASKKGMQFLQSLLGPATTDDDAKLLSAALDSGVPRVVVKRPKGAELLAGSELFSGQRTVIESPNTRYDIYISHENSDIA